MPGQDWPGFHLQPTTYTHVPQKNKYWCNHVGAMPLKMAIFLSTHFKSDFVISASAFESWLSVSLVLCFHRRAKNKTLNLSTWLMFKKTLIPEKMHHSLIFWFCARVSTKHPAQNPGQPSNGGLCLAPSTPQWCLLSMFVQFMRVCLLGTVCVYVCVCIGSVCVCVCV